MPRTPSPHLSPDPGRRLSGPLDETSRAPLGEVSRRRGACGPAAAWAAPRSRSTGADARLGRLGHLTRLVGQRLGDRDDFAASFTMRKCRQRHDAAGLGRRSTAIHLAPQLERQQVSYAASKNTPVQRSRVSGRTTRRGSPPRVELARDAKARALVKATRGATSELFANSRCGGCASTNPSARATAAEPSVWNPVSSHHLGRTSAKQEALGVTFRTVDPFTSRRANWWRATAHRRAALDPDTAQRAGQHAHRALNRRA